MILLEFLIKNYIRIILLVVYSLCVVSVSEVEAQTLTSTRGKDFIISFLPNFHEKPSGDSLVIYASGSPGTNVTLTSRTRIGTIQTRLSTIGANGVVSFSYEWGLYEPYGYNDSKGNLAARDNGQIIRPFFRVVSSDTIAVYALNQAVATSDAALIYPVSELGREYKILSYYSHVLLDTDGTVYSTNSEAIVTAIEDNTVVDIIANVDLVAHTSRSFSVTLNRGESYLLQAMINGSTSKADLTGTLVTADKPVAVFAGHQRSYVTYVSSPNVSRDHLYEQMPPVNQWGKRFHVVPFPSNNSKTQSDVYRIIPLVDNTHIYVNNTLVASLDRNDIFEERLLSPMYIRSDQPILVGVLKASMFASGGTVGDPALLIVPPIEQYMKNYTVQNILAFGTQDDKDEVVYSRQFITIVIPRTAIPSFRLDGKGYSESVFQKIPFTAKPGDCQEYMYAHISVNTGSHKLTANDYFAALVIGYGDVNSYGYVGGLATRKQFDETPPLIALKDTTICQGRKVKLNVSGGDGKYIWKPNTNISCTTCTEPEVKPDKTTKYIVESRDVFNCPIFDTVTVKVKVIDADAGPNQSICPGSSAQLQVTGGEIFTWQSDNTLSCLDCPNPIAKPVKKTSYYVRIAYKDGCYRDDTVTVDTRSLTTDAGKDTTLCNGASLQLNAIGGKTFEWVNDPSLSCTDCQSPIAKPTKKTTYYLTARDGDCVAKDSITVSVTTPFVDAGNDTTICLGNGAYLTASSGKKYEWKSDPTLLCNDCKTTIVKPNKTTTYFVRVYQDDLCFADDSVTVRVNSVDVHSSNDTIICFGERAQLSVIGADKYLWTPAKGLSCTDCQNPIANPTKTTEYIVKGFDKDGCMGIDTVVVKIDKLESDISNDTLLCVGQSVRLNVQGGKKVRWLNPKYLDCDTCFSLTATPLETITYYTEVSGEVCKKIDSVTITVSDFSISLGNDTSVCRGNVAFLKSTKAEKYQWLPNVGLSCTDCQSPIAKPEITTTYKCFGWNEYGCTAIDSVTVFVSNCLTEDTLIFNKIIACGDSTIEFNLVNNDQFVKEQKVNVSLISGDKDVFSLSSEKKFPYVIQSGEAITLYFTFSPRRNGIFNTVCEILFESGEKRLITIKGESIIGELSISVKDTTSVTPGDKIVITGYASSDNWQLTKTDTLNITAEYATRMLIQEGEILTGDVNKEWTILPNIETKGIRSYLHLFMTGEQRIHKDGSIFRIPFKTLLADSERILIHYTVKPTRYGCIVIPQVKSSIGLTSCFMTGRRLETSLTPYTLDLESTAEALIIHCSIGLDSRTKLILYNSLGEEISLLMDTYTDSGVYDLVIPKSELSHGLYHIVLQSGVYSLVKSIIP